MGEAESCGGSKQISVCLFKYWWISLTLKKTLHFLQHVSWLKRFFSPPPLEGKRFKTRIVFLCLGMQRLKSAEYLYLPESCGANSFDCCWAFHPLTLLRQHILILISWLITFELSMLLRNHRIWECWDSVAVFSQFWWPSGRNDSISLVIEALSCWEKN